MKKATAVVIVLAILAAIVFAVNRMDYVRFGYHGKAVHFTTDTERKLKKIGDGVKGLFQ
ncbi:MAG: hypothetical protein J0L75_17940 [Spirochaetes bacterium]|nr:hypothetical protein [Spirochaetota bacterium]